MERKELIEKVITEIHDRKLKEELLKALVEEKNESSLLLKEAARLGFNPEGVKDRKIEIDFDRPLE